MGKSISRWQGRKRAVGGINRLQEDCDHSPWVPRKVLVRLHRDLCFKAFISLPSSSMAPPVVTFHGQKSPSPIFRWENWDSVRKRDETNRWWPSHLADLCSKGLVFSKWNKGKEKNTPYFVRATMISNFQSIILGWGGCNSIKDRNIKGTVKPSHVQNL